MFRTFWKFVGVAVMALAVSAPVSHAKQRLLMGTSTGGGSYYVLGGTWSNALNGKLGDKVDLSIEVTGGPETNIMLIENKEMDLGMVTAWQAGDMYDGKGKVPQKFQSMRSFTPLYPSYLQIYALADSGLTSTSCSRPIPTGRRASSPREPTRPPRKIFRSFPCGTSPWPTRISPKTSSTR